MEDRFDLANSVSLTEQSEYKLLNQGKLNGLLVTAEYDWGEGETHFAPHRFWIDVFRFNQTTHRYKRIAHYLTAKKYSSLDDNSIDVIAPEEKNILKLI